MFCWNNVSGFLVRAVMSAGFCTFVLTICPDGLLGDGNPPAGEDDPAPSFTDALTKGSASINLRYRLETVSDEVLPDENALASTLRTTLSYKTLTSSWGLGGFIEFENVTVAGDDEGYNNAGGGNLSNGITDKPVVADPEVTEVNQVYLSITKIRDTRIDIGRQELILRKARFVGNVGWRQDHQSFDALTAVNRSMSKTTLMYSYIHNVNRIFGDNMPLDAHIIDAVVDVNEHAKFTGFAYLLDLRRNSQAALSTATLGGSLSGGHAASDRMKILYSATFAKQSDFADNPNPVDADYYRLEGGAKIHGRFTVNAMYEVLGGSPTSGSFQTPLATLHAWNGWADKFLTTPANGLKDLSISGGVTQGTFGIQVIYHDFKADEGGDPYGSEVDILANWKSGWEQLFAVKMALYSADTFAADTNKIMFFTTYRI